MRERYHPFNTARMVHHALRNSSLVVDHVDKLGGLLPPFGPRAGLLFPSPDAQIISEVPRCDAPDQLVVLDGTWKHAKRILLSLPVLKALPKYRLVPSAPGQYRIRLEPTSDALSTVEATVEALRVLEPDTDGLDQLLGAFRTMVDTQLAHPQAYYPRNTER